MDTLTLLTGLAIVVGLVGTVLVVFPGILVVWGAVLVWSLLGDDSWRWAVLAFATAVLAASTVLKYLLPGRRLSESGVPGWSIAIAALAGIVGFFAIPVVGFFVGFVVGLLVVELVRLRDWSVAWPATVQALTAVGLSVAIELFAALLMAAAWGTAVLVG